MNDDYIPGMDCICSAYNESECGCGVDWTPKRVYELERELAVVTEQRDRLAEAGQAVVDRWHTPLWKDVPHTAKFIQNLEAALASVKGGANE